MLDKDIVKTEIELPCGCILYHEMFIVSGVQHDTAKELIKARYDFELGKDTLLPMHSNTKNLDKLVGLVDIKKMCYYHLNVLFSSIVSGVKKYYGELPAEGT